MLQTIELHPKLHISKVNKQQEEKQAATCQGQEGSSYQEPSRPVTNLHACL